MNTTLNIIAAAIIIVVLVVLITLKLRSTKLDKRYYQKKWLELQKLCSDRKLWYQAVIEADELLDDVLKKRHFHGKTTGERLVAAQRTLSSNDSVWFGHKLKNKIAEQNFKKPNKRDTLEALSGFRQALKDLGALGGDRDVRGPEDE